MSGGELSRRGDTRWAGWSLLPLGLGAWTPIFAGVRARKPLWTLIGVVLTVIAMVGWVVAAVTNGDSALAGGLIIFAWVGAVATSFTIRQAYARALESPWADALESAESKLAERDRARRLARQRPRLALEMGIGRPDVPGAHDAGLIDVNHAGRGALMRLPGIDGTLAAQIIAVRGRIHGFLSLEDLGAALDLDGHLVEDLRDRVVFLPR